MVGWAGWLVPFFVMVLVGIGATLYLLRIRLPREQAAAGVASLAAMRWRDFIHLVLDALIRRGYERVFEPGDSDQDGSYVLEREGQRFLLSSKHGAAYVLGSTAIAEFANAIRMRGAAGGLLVTPGRFAPEAAPLARAQRIELLDGPTLWPELQPLLPEDQRTSVAAPSVSSLYRSLVMAWSVAIVAAIALFTLLHHERATGTSAGNAVQAAAAQPIQHPVALAKPARPVKPGARAASSPEPTDPVQVEARRRNVADAISRLPGVDRAIWETQSTLLVYLLDDQFNPLPGICPELERYDELAASRLQLQPPAGSARPVRFVQCRAY